MVLQSCLSSKGGKLLMIILLTLSGVAVASEPRIQIEGRAQYSFRPGHYVLETSRGTLHVRGDDLDSTARLQFDRATASAGEVKIEVPVRSVEYYSGATDVVGNLVDVPDIEGLWFLDSNHARLEGTKRMSWEESFYLVQAGLNIYKISLSKLSQSQVNSVRSVGPGGHVSVELPIRSIELAWTLPLPALELPALERLADEIKVEMDLVTITGTVLWSWQESKSHVLSRDQIIRFNRAAVDAVAARDLDHPGSRISVRVPLAAVEAMWPAEQDETPIVRDPAGLMP